jgi:hypothetical protein
MGFSFDYSWGYYPLAGGGPLPTANLKTDKISVKFYPVWYRQVTLEWSVPAVWGHCLFNIYRCETESGPFTRLNQTPINSNHFADTSTMEFSKFNKDYYIVEAILPGGATLQSSAISIENVRSTPIQLKALDIQRREWILLSKFNGAKTLAFRRKTYGKRCSLCWNPDTERVMRDNCPNCLGTSFDGGYFPAYETFVNYDPTPNALILEYFGKSEPNQIPAWTIGVPELNSFDVLVRLPDWKVYRIAQINATELQTVPVRQIMQLIELSKETVEYQLIQKDSTAFPVNYQVART